MSTPRKQRDRSSQRHRRQRGEVAVMRPAVPGQAQDGRETVAYGAARKPQPYRLCSPVPRSQASDQGYAEGSQQNLCKREQRIAADEPGATNPARVPGAQARAGHQREGRGGGDVSPDQLACRRAAARMRPTVQVQKRGQQRDHHQTVQGCENARAEPQRLRQQSDLLLCVYGGEHGERAARLLRRQPEDDGDRAEQPHRGHVAVT